MILNVLRGVSGIKIPILYLGGGATPRTVADDPVSAAMAPPATTGRSDINASMTSFMLVSVLFVDSRVASLVGAGLDGWKRPLALLLN